MGIAKKSRKILEEHLPTLEEDIKDIKDKTMTPTVASDVEKKALEILEKNFKGAKLEAMKAKLQETMKTMQENYGEIK